MDERLNNLRKQRIKGTEDVNILLAVDHSDASRKAVDFAGEVLGKTDSGGIAVTLLHVVESLPDYLLNRVTDENVSSADKQVADEWTENDRAKGEELLAESKRHLVDQGVGETTIETKLLVKSGTPEARKVVAALAIIEQMKQGPYDVVCLVRRGFAAAAGSFLGSVAEKVLREAAGKTVWVVD